MTRKKVKLAWIANSSARRASLKKRRLGLVKKVMELTTLCGIEACVIIYSPDEHQPVVWPSHDEVQRQLGKFYLVPELERTKKMMNLETYIKERLSKSQDQLMKLNRKNKEVEVGQFMLQMHQGKMMDEFNVNELDGLIWFMETRMTNIRKRIEYYEQVPFSSAGPSQGDVPLLPPPQGPADHDIGGANAGVGDNERISNESFLWDHWFHNIITADEFRGGASSSSVRSDMGLTHYNPFAGTTAGDLGLPGPSFGGTASSSVAPHLGLPGPFYGGSSSIAPDLRLPGPSFGGSSIAAAELGPPRPSFVGGSSSSVAAADLGLPGPSFGGSSSAALDHGLPPFGTFSGPTTDTGLTEGGNFAPFGGHDMGPGHYPFGPVGSSSPGSEFGGNPFGFFGGESSSSGAAGSSEMGPFDDKDWPSNISP